MIEPKKAAFSFIDFKIPKFSYNEIGGEGSDLTIGFSPSGVYNSKTGEFEINFKFVAKRPSDPENTIIDLFMTAIFKFKTPIEFSEIPDYFYKNSIAIAFPYLRAFISTLTLQANTKLLKLGLLNLSELDQPLKENTVVV
ncbi:MAG TPA: hypothetical protein PLB59_01980 [Bacteroidales bacterium]|nr:hypothetical protein [Bacteroidales bacterium]HQP14711.1 hypothetical protein [Bacteroidales bacterium]